MKHGPLAVAAALFFSSGVARADDLDGLRTRWRAAQDYLPVLDALTDWRGKHPWSAEVDYMIGTAACRTPSRASLGAIVLRSLADRDIGSDVRRVVLDECNVCEHPAAPPLQVVWVYLPQASVGVSGKYFGMNLGEFADGKSMQEHLSLAVTAPIDPSIASKRLLLRSSPLDLGRQWPNVAKAFPSWNGAPLSRASAGYLVWAAPTDNQATLDALAKGLDDFEAFLVGKLGAEHPAQRISVYLVGRGQAARDAAMALHGVNLPSDFIGYDARSDWSIVLVEDFGLGTAYHEATHLVLRTNFGNLPPWLDEGVASLYEQSRSSGADFIGLPNYRQALLKQVSPPPALQDLLKMTWAEVDSDGGSTLPVRYALARSWALYLQDKGRLAEVVRETRKSWQPLRRKETDVEVVERVLGQKLDAVENDFRGWLAALPAVPPSVRAMTPDVSSRCSICNCVPAPNTPARQVAQVEQKQECPPDACDGCAAGPPAPQAPGLIAQQPPRVPPSTAAGCACDLAASRATDPRFAVLGTALALAAGRWRNRRRRKATGKRSRSG
ncbi:MAG TPA: hypothetical protein VGI39_38405 [Polyangiaceae bacterium]